MKIIIAANQIPFARDPGMAQAEGLRSALTSQGHQVEIAAIPFKDYPTEGIVAQMAACRLIDLSEIGTSRIDLLIGLHFPSYLVSHPSKVLWVTGQCPPAYEPPDAAAAGLHPQAADAEIARAILNADRGAVAQARSVYASSHFVAARLQSRFGIGVAPLYHPPPGASDYYCAQASDYLLFDGRAAPVEGYGFVIEALALTRQPVRACFLGTPGSVTAFQELRARAGQLDLLERIEWVEAPSGSGEPADAYARALGVISPVEGAGYDYSTLQAMLSRKPAIVRKDSGCAAEFVRQDQTGLVVDPVPVAAAAAMDALWSAPARAAAMGEAGRRLYDALDISWHNVVKHLLA